MSNNELHIKCERSASLFNALKEILPSLPGFRSLSLFGSQAEGRADEYSDLDVIVTTDDLPNAKTQLLGILEEQIGPVDFCWAINLRADEWNPIVVFRDEGYYQRLELGLTDTSAVNRTIPAEQTILLCEEPRNPVNVIKESDAYTPAEGSMGHFLLGQFIGCIRYLKARKRGETLTCYRFAAAAVAWSLSLQYARLIQNPHFRSKLSTDDFRKMDSLLSIEDRNALLSGFDFSKLIAMDCMVRITMDKMLEDGLFLAAMLGETLPTEVFERMSTFMAEELRYV